MISKLKYLSYNSIVNQNNQTANENQSEPNHSFIYAFVHPHFCTKKEL